MPDRTVWPVPPNDSGIMAHLSPVGQKPLGYKSTVPTMINWMRRMGFSWGMNVLTADFISDVQKYTIQAQVDAGMEPVARLYWKGPYPRNTDPSDGQYSEMATAIRELTKIGVHYFQTRNEPNLADEWQAGVWNATSNDAKVEEVANTAMQDANLVLLNGGIPLLPPFSPGGDWDDEVMFPAVCHWWSAHAYDSILKQCVLSIHDYTLSHPVDFPYDQINQLSHPGSTVLSGGGMSNGANKRYWARDTFRSIMGFDIPIMSTEGGCRPGDSQDNRYPATTPESHAQLNLAIADTMARRNEPWFLCYCYWILGTRVFDIPYSAWDGDAWLQPNGQHLPVVKAFLDRGFVAKGSLYVPIVVDPVPPPVVVIAEPVIKDVTRTLPTNPSVEPYETRSIGDVQEIVIHHSAAGGMVTPTAVAKWHIGTPAPDNGNGWPGIGYHFYITSDGTIYQTNALTTISYQALGQNTDSIGICFAGDFTQTQPTAIQRTNGAWLLAKLLKDLDLPNSSVYGHGDLPGQSTQCPAGTWWKELLPKMSELELLKADYKVHLEEELARLKAINFLVNAQLDVVTEKIKNV
jgi:hypothetical protein